MTIFQVNGLLVESGSALVADLGLTTARWQVLGAIARAMGLTRQSVQRVVNALDEDGLVRFDRNPNHRPASLVRLTAAGMAAYDAAMHRH